MRNVVLRNTRDEA